MKIVVVTQARVGSSRLPAKVLRKLGEKTLLQMHLERAMAARLPNDLIVATTTESDAKEIKSIAHKAGARCVHGSLDDVLDRFYQAVKDDAPDYVVRITSDCPLIDPALMDKVIAFALEKSADYISNTLDPSFPDGQDIEVIKFSALEKAWREATLPSEREHVTSYIWKNSSFHGHNLFESFNYYNDTDFSQVRLTVDETSDAETMDLLVQQLGDDATWLEYATFYTAHIHEMPNYALQRNEGYTKSLLADENRRNA